MTDRSIRIRVGASLDADTTAVFRPLIDAAKKARSAIDADMNKAAKGLRGLGPAAKDGASKADRALADLERQLKGLPSPIDKVGGAARKFGKDAEASFSIAKDRFNDLARDAARNAKDIERDMARVQKARAKAFGKAGKWAAKGVSQVSMMAARGSLNAGRRIAGDVLSGAGVRVDLAAGVAQNVDLEKRAVDLSNAGFMAGDTRNGTRVDKGALVSQVRDVANQTAFDPTQAMEGLQAFVGKTGDLALGRDILKDMAVLSKATGTELEHMVDAAGDAANQLGDMPGKGEVLVEIMRGIAGQGKLGAVEIKDMAKQMAKVAAAASQFEGSAKDNIILMGAFAQESRQRGGSASATQAATGVGSFINTFSKNARLNAFAGFGVQVQGNGGLRNAQAIVTDSLNAAMKHGGPNSFSRNMGQMFMDAQARRTVRGFETVYRRAYDAKSGTDQDKMAEGTAAVTAEFERLKDVAMSQAEVQESFERAMDTSESRVQIFNNQMAQTAAQLQDSLLPAFMDLAPIVVEATHAFADAVESVFGKKGKREAEEEIRKTNIMSHAMHALGAGSEDETQQIYDPRTGTWRQKGREVDSRIPGQIDEQVSETERALADAKADEAKKRASYLGGTAGLGWDDEKLRTLAAHGGSHAQDILGSEDRVLQLERNLEEQKTIQSALLEAIRSGTLQVKVMNPGDLAKKRNATADMSGTAPAESPIDSE